MTGHPGLSHGRVSLLSEVRLRQHLPAHGGDPARIQAQRLQVHPEVTLLESRIHSPGGHCDSGDGGKRRPRRPVRTLALLLQAARGDGNPSAAIARYLHAGSHSSTKGQTHPGNQTSEYGATRKPILPRLRRVQCACAAGLPGLVFLKGLYLPPRNAPLSPTEKTTSPTEHCCVVSDLLQVNRYFAENARYPFRILESFI